MDASANAVPRVAPEPLRAFVARVFEAAGLPTKDARSVAELMVEADLRGSDTHGVIRVPLYLKRMRGGGINMRPNIRVVSEKASAALVDGDNGVGHLVMRYAAEVAIRKARETGVGWVGARMSNHAGPGSLYATMPLAHDMIGLYFAVGSSNHLPPWGGKEVLLGTNPVAIAAPAGEESAVVMDMAPTVASFGKVRLYAQRGDPMPVGWMVDDEGEPLTDASRAGEGYLLPIGDYKGYALAMMIGLLAGTLNRAAFGREVVDMGSAPNAITNTGHAIAAIAIDTFCPPAEFKRQVDAVVRDLRNSQRLPGVERIYVPGEQSALKARDRAQNGIPLSKALKASLDAAAKEAGVEPLST
jgi:LDH2 family malate/lactate/ureidoglycolate dehydrogenase